MTAVMESLPRKRERAAEIVQRLYDAYPKSECSLVHADPFQLLVATMLSAQCTDERVNMVTPELFSRYPDVKSMAEASVEDIADIIRSTGFFNTKSRNIQACARTLLIEHGGKVPRDLEVLVKLPGVGRKTANVVLGTGFGVPGIVVDTHVIRITNLLELTRQSDAVKIEHELEKVLAEEHWIMFTHMIIDHGRAVCIARRPQCHTCVLAALCPSVLPDEQIRKKGG